MKTIWTRPWSGWPSRLNFPATLTLGLPVEHPAAAQQTAKQSANKAIRRIQLLPSSKRTARRVDSQDSSNGMVLILSINIPFEDSGAPHRALYCGLVFKSAAGVVRFPIAAAVHINPNLIVNGLLHEADA